jgi:hypothetical protein
MTLAVILTTHDAPAFPSMQVHHPIDYARVVQRIGNEMDLTQVDVDDLLPAASVMVVTVTATTTSGKPLSEDMLQKVQAGCEMALQLDHGKQLVRDTLMLHGDGAFLCVVMVLVKVMVLVRIHPCSAVG